MALFFFFFKSSFHKHTQFFSSSKASNSRKPVTYKSPLKMPSSGIEGFEEMKEIGGIKYKRYYQNIFIQQQKKNFSDEIVKVRYYREQFVLFHFQRNKVPTSSFDAQNLYHFISRFNLKSHTTIFLLNGFL